MITNIKKIVFLLVIISQLYLSYAKKYWVCSGHPKVICHKTQTCCRKLVNGPGENHLIPLFECFDGKNQICCGNNGVCKSDENCNQILNVCEKIKDFGEMKEENKKQPDKKPKENKLNFMYDESGPEINKLQSELENLFSNAHFLLNNSLIVDYFNNVFNSTETVFKLNISNISPDNVIDFIEGFMRGLYIFESAYRNSSCEKKIKIARDDFMEFISLIKSLEIDKHFWDKLHLAVDMGKHLHKDYIRMRRRCIKTIHKLSCRLKKVLDRVLDPQFPRILAGHTIIYYKDLENKLKSASLELKNHHYSEAGYEFGDFLRFFAFWDFVDTKRSYKC